MQLRLLAWLFLWVACGAAAQTTVSDAIGACANPIVAARRLLSARNGTFATALPPAHRLASPPFPPLAPRFDTNGSTITAAAQMPDSLRGVVPLSIARATVCRGPFARMP